MYIEKLMMIKSIAHKLVIAAAALAWLMRTISKGVS